MWDAGLGVRLVIVLGAQPQIDNALRERSAPSDFIGSYRITSATALEAAVEAAGRGRTAVEQFLSRVWRDGCSACASACL